MPQAVRYFKGNLGARVLFGFLATEQVEVNVKHLLYGTERLGGIFWNADLSDFHEEPERLGEERLIGTFDSLKDAEDFAELSVRPRGWTNLRIVEAPDPGFGI
jgi:hypothetical protein